MYDELPNPEHIESEIRHYDEFLQSNPSSHDAWHSRGHLLCKLKRYEQAIASYDKAIEVKPDYAVSWYERGLALTALGEFEAAVSSYDKSCKLNPNDYKSWLEQGRVLYRLGSYGAARLSFNRATQYQPDSAVAWYWYGVAVDSIGHGEKALSSLNKALELAPNCPYILAAQGKVLRKLGQYDAALASYNQALQQNKVLEEAKSSSYQEFRAIHHGSNLCLSLLCNPMLNLNMEQFRYATEEISCRMERKCWFRSGRPDLYLPGDTEHLDQDNLRLAEETLLQLEQLERTAINYLERFVDRRAAGTYGESDVVSVYCGFMPNCVELSINFDTDVYGLWFVVFSRQGTKGWQPVLFGRQTW